MADGDVLSPERGVLVTPAPTAEVPRVSGLVSVIMPVFDVRDYVGAAIDSVLAQSYRDLELLVVDDGSTDGTDRVVAERASSDPRVRLGRVPRGGPNAARNAALREARGEFLTFLDGDDLLLPGAYAAMTASLRQSGSDFAVAPYLRLTGDGTKPPARWIRRAHRERRTAVRAVDHPDVMVNAVQWSKLYRRRFWDGFVREFALPGFYQDQLVSARAYGHARRIDVLTEPSVAWRLRHDGSSMTQQIVTGANMRDRFRTAHESLEILDQLGGRRLHDVRLRHYLNNDFGITVGRLSEVSDDYWQTLVREVRSFSELADRAGIWDHVKAQHKVVYHLIRQDERDAVNAFDRAGGRAVKGFDVERRDDGVYACLPGWREGLVPEWCFRLTRTQARALLDRA